MQLQHVAHEDRFVLLACLAKDDQGKTSRLDYFIFEIFDWFQSDNNFATLVASGALIRIGGVDVFTYKRMRALYLAYIFLITEKKQQRQRDGQTPCFPLIF